MNKTILTEDTFDELFNPQQNHQDDFASWNGQMYETFGPEIDYVLSFANDFNRQKRVWTLLEVDGKQFVSAGYHMVNRMGYFITEKSWETGLEEFHIEEVDSDEPLSYIIYKDDYSDREFYDLISVQCGLPEYNDLFDREGEICEDYSALFAEGTSVEVLHENIRIQDIETLKKFLMTDAGIMIKMQEDINGGISDEICVQLSGDGGELGFILDVWESKEDMNENEPCKSYQFWFDDYDYF